MKIAIIGSGIAGNTIAHHLHREHDVHVFEAGSHIGGHSDTHDIELDGRHYAVDTGFIVFNHATYPHFSALLAELGVASQESSMSFSVRCERSGLEYNGNTINTLFAQRRNLLRPVFWRMIRDILRFNREAPSLLRTAKAPHEPDISLGRYLDHGRYSREFREWYILPMGSAIWSTDPSRLLQFPARSFVRFFHNHGMLTINDRPQWRTIAGGSREYVRRLTAPFADRIRLETPALGVRRRVDGVTVRSRHGAEQFDRVFFACHSDQALHLLEDASPLEAATLGAIPYQASELVLHTDASLLPKRRLAWAAWNYHLLPDAPPCSQALEPGRDRAATLTYNMNILQRIESPHTFCVTLNRPEAIDPRRVLKRMTYYHPVFTPAGLAAQQRHADIDGVHGSYFCGAYWRHGFHEDGVFSALESLRHFRERESVEVSGLERQLSQPARPVDELPRDHVRDTGFAL